jgi:tripartite-type tricarboxylate transporter receptor subunit TctC
MSRSQLSPRRIGGDFSPDEARGARRKAGASSFRNAGELFKAMSGTNIVHIPPKTSGAMRNSVLGGRMQRMFVRGLSER